MITKEAVLAALSQVQEPDLGKDLVTLNMVKDIEIEGKNVSFTVVLTTPACPLKEMIEKVQKAESTHTNTMQRARKLEKTAKRRRREQELLI